MDRALSQWMCKEGGARLSLTNKRRLRRPAYKELTKISCRIRGQNACSGSLIPTLQSSLALLAESSIFTLGAGDPLSLSKCYDP